MTKEANECSPEIKKLVLDIATEMGLSQFIKFKVFNVPKATEVVELKMHNILTKALVDNEVFVLVYEDAFDRVDDKTKYMWIRLAMDCVSYDSEKEKVSIKTPMVKVPLYSYQKFGKVAVDNAELAIHTINQIQEEEKMRKAEEKTAKKDKKKKLY